MSDGSTLQLAGCLGRRELPSDVFKDFVFKAKAKAKKYSRPTLGTPKSRFHSDTLVALHIEPNANRSNLWYY